MFRKDEKDPYEYRPNQWPDWSLRDRHSRFAKGSRRGQLVGILIGLASGGWIVQGVLDSHLSRGVTVAVFVVLGVYAVLYVVGATIGLRSPHRTRIAYVTALFGLGLVPTLLSHDAEKLTVLVYALICAVMMLPVRVSRVLALVTIAGQILAMWLVDGSIEWGAVWLLFGLAFGMSAFMMLIFTVARLRSAHGEIQSLAVAEERERLARDLHDILGHSLTTITVKAGLARRMLEQDGEHPATEQVGDVEELARQALTDIRATVSNYRTASLPAELAGARMSLQAAQIRPELPHAVDDVDPGLQEVFGYVVREAVTNVIRHSGADRCVMRLGRRWVEVTDNGSVESGPADPDGNGLRGLRERLAAEGGELEACRCADGGFRVLARVPEGRT